jgi:hypothetical protein
MVADLAQVDQPEERDHLAGEDLFALPGRQKFRVCQALCVGELTEQDLHLISYFFPIFDDFCLFKIEFWSSQLFFHFNRDFFLFLVI